MITKKIKELFNFDYCITAKLNECDSYQFGWKEGLHFYVDDYYFNTEHEGQYMMVVWLNKEIKYNSPYFEISSLLTDIKMVLNEYNK